MKHLTLSLIASLSLSLIACAPTSGSSSSNDKAKGQTKKEKTAAQLSSDLAEIGASEEAAEDFRQAQKPFNMGQSVAGLSVSAQAYKALIENGGCSVRPINEDEIESRIDKKESFQDTREVLSGANCPIQRNDKLSFDHSIDGKVEKTELEISSKTNIDGQPDYTDLQKKLIHQTDVVESERSVKIEFLSQNPQGLPQWQLTRFGSFTDSQGSLYQRELSVQTVVADDDRLEVEISAVFFLKNAELETAKHTLSRKITVIEPTAGAKKNIIVLENKFNAKDISEEQYNQLKIDELDLVVESMTIVPAI